MKSVYMVGLALVAMLFPPPLPMTQPDWFGVSCQADHVPPRNDEQQTENRNAPRSLGRQGERFKRTGVTSLP